MADGVTDYEKVQASVPVNGLAVKSILPGVKWEPHLRIANVLNWQDVPWPTRPIHSSTLIQPTFRDLTGIRVCRLEILGYSLSGRNGQSAGKACWSVRCDCGRYGLWRTKFLVSEAAKTRGMCPWCEKLVEMQTGCGPSEYKRTSKLIGAEQASNIAACRDRIKAQIDRTRKPKITEELQ
jgi:hypothetical protein